jgi:hypothetical protein
MVKRRKFVIGLGALVAGSGAALGTGASVNSTMSRNGDIEVVNDSKGLLALNVGNEADSDVVSMQNGQLAIDFSGRDNGETNGVNVNSKYQVGSLTGGNNDIAVFDKEGGGPTSFNAFTVVNNDTARRDITLEYTLDSDHNLQEDGSYLYFEARPLSTLPDGRAPIKDMTVDHGNTTASFSYSADNYNDDSIDSGNGIGVSILVDTTGDDASTSEDLSGTLTVSGGSPPK